MMNQKTLWIVTGLVVVLMLVGAVFIARQRATVPVAAPVAAIPVPAEQQIAVAPVEPALSITPQAAPAPEPSKPIIYDEVKVDISNIAGKLKMSSPNIPATTDGSLPRYPVELTCYRSNVSPSLNWNGAPSATKSYVLVLERRAPHEKASWTWILFNIPPSSSGVTGKLSEESLAAGQGLFGMNPYGHKAYTGPCEPKGVFPYVLRLFALDTELPLQAGASLPQILPAMNGHVIDAAEIRAEHYLQR